MLAMTARITFTTLAAANIKVAIGCYECRTLRPFGAGAFVGSPKGHVDLVEAWNRGLIRCETHHRAADVMIFTWNNPMGSRDREVARWSDGATVAAFDLPDAKAGPSA